MHYLMIKTHNKTNLKYLCKKSTNKKNTCFCYTGSGTYWKKHLKIHGYDISTEIIEECATKEELIEKGIYWSIKLNVVNSDEWANLVPERGDGGPTMLGRKITLEQKKRQCAALQKFHANKTPVYSWISKRINSLSHALLDKQVYITPAGEFFSCSAASKKLKLSISSIKSHCVRGSNNDLIDCKKMGKSLFFKKTWKDMGYDMRPMTRLEIMGMNTKINKYKQLLKQVNALRPCPKLASAIAD
jgi:hypothetical protein